MVLIVPESTSRKNECRKLLLPFTSLHLNQNLFLCLGFVVVIFVWFFVWLGFFWFFVFVFCLFVCSFIVLGVYSVEEEPWRRGKNSLHVQLAQGDSNHSSQLLGKASQDFPGRQAGRQI